MDLTVACGPVDTPQNCGSCGNTCPGLGLPTDDVSCTSGSCTLACRGENYDVNGKASDGCEHMHTGMGHTPGAANSLGSRSCDDGSIGIFSGTMLSDARTHANPALANFNAAVGSATDFWVVYATGGFCENDYSVTFNTGGGGDTPCYALTFLNQTTSAISGHGSTSIWGGLGSYPSDSSLYFSIKKICNLPVQEVVTYSVSYHL